MTQMGNYDLVILTEKNIQWALYCKNCLGYDVGCLSMDPTVAAGAQGGVKLFVI